MFNSFLFIQFLIYGNHDQRYNSTDKTNNRNYKRGYKIGVLDLTGSGLKIGGLIVIFVGTEDK